MILKHILTICSYVKKDEKITLLESIINYKISDSMLYVTASKGYAVIGDDNIARIYVASENKIENEKIKYLDSFEDFEKNEQEILRKMK